MAFNVNLFSLSKEVNSTKQPTGSGTEYSCVSNDDLDTLHPRIPLNIGAAANPSAYNYMYIASFGRYYWIRKWTFETGLWVAYCDVDPLASWKSQIGSTSAYVLRAAAANDGTIVDNMYPTKASPSVTNVSLTKWWDDNDLDYTEGCFVVGTINKYGATQYALLQPSEFVQFATAAFSDAFFNTVKDQTWMTKAIFDPMQYLSSVTWFPFDMSGASGRSVDVYLGYWDTGVRGLFVGTTRDLTQTVTLPKHPQRGTRGAYLDAAPFSTYVLDIPPFGRMELKSDLLAGQASITVSAVIDWISGRGVLRVKNASGDPIILQEAQIGVTVQISQVLRDYFGGAMSVASGALSAVGNALVGNITGAISGGLSAIGSAVTAAQPNVTTSGMNSGFSGLAGSWHLTALFYQLVPEDNTHRGRPLCQVRTLSTLSGFQLCTNTDVSIPATREEIDMIRGYLESGYYYE